MDATLLAEQIVAHQSPGGAFQSRVRLRFGEVTDRNCFVTALVLRELGGIDGFPGLETARRRALGYLTRSRYPVYRDLFSFYPHRSHPFWMRAALYPDADDTSVIGVELFRAGLLPRSALVDIAQRYLLVYRSGELGPAPRGWQRTGTFLTWLTSAPVENRIDCCVNTNVLALLAFAELQTTDAFGAACEMINSAAATMALDPACGHSFTPFYPRAREWYRAVDHAVGAGVDELAPALDRLGGLPGVNDLSGESVCSDVTGTVVWNADVLGLARRLRHSVLHGAENVA